MSDDILRTTRTRVWDQASRAELVDHVLEEIGSKIREAFQAVSQEARTLSDLSTAAGEILAHSMAELEVRRRVDSALQWKAIISILKKLPDDARREIENELKTLDLEQLDP